MSYISNICISCGSSSILCFFSFLVTWSSGMRGTFDGLLDIIYEKCCDNLRLLMVVPSSRGFPIALGGNIPLSGYGYVTLIQSEIKQIQSCTSVFEKASQILVHPLVAE